MAKQLRITVEGKTYDVTVETVGETATVTNVAPAAPKAAAVVASAAAAPVPAASAAPAKTSAAPVAATAGSVLAPLAAVVVSIDVKLGQQVTAGTKVATVEAMKMNTIVETSVSGSVQAIHVNPGQAVEEGQPLLTIG
jgi:biotin carboxyl carrier protein